MDYKTKVQLKTWVIIIFTWTIYYVVRNIHHGPFTNYDFIIVIAIGYFISLKINLGGSVASSYDFPDAMPEQFPMLDRKSFERIAAELESLSFEKVRDFSLVGQGGARIPSFCRLYIQPQERLYVELAQIFPPGSMPKPILCSIQTFYDQDWSLGVANSQPQAASVFIRNPHSIGRYMPGKSPHDLLLSHREWRDQMIHDLGIQPQPVSWDAYSAQNQKRAQQRIDIMRKSSMIANFAKFLKRQALPVYEWKGDWPTEAEKRKLKGF